MNKLQKSMVLLAIEMTKAGKDTYTILETIEEKELEAEIDKLCGDCPRFMDDCDGIGTKDRKYSVNCADFNPGMEE